MLLTHVLPLLHLPQSRVPPQPSEVVPQFMPSPAHVTGVQPPPQTLLVQVCPAAQTPQSSVPPQPSEAVPQLKPRFVHVVGMQQTLLMHVSPFVQPPQLSVLPVHGSVALPQSKPSIAQLAGQEVQKWYRSQYCLPGQLPQFSVPPQ
jgi:hypothetical protein